MGSSEEEQWWLTEIFGEETKHSYGKRKASTAFEEFIESLIESGAFNEIILEELGIDSEDGKKRYATFKIAFTHSHVH